MMRTISVLFLFSVFLLSLKLSLYQRSSFSVSGQIAVITGAGDGIGKAIGIKLASEGCNLALVDIRKDKVDAVAQSIQFLFPSIKVYAFECDMTSLDAVQSLVENVKSSFNTKCVQLLFNNVGIGGTGSTLYGDIGKLQREMDVNLWSMVYGIRSFLPMLLANDVKQQCFIVNSGSMASINSGFVWYSVTKHAVIALSENIREELKKLHPKHKNICVSTLVPAFVKTNIRRNSQQALGDEISEKMEKEFQRSRQGQMIRATEMNVNVLANIVFDGLKEKKAVIVSHLDWYEAAIKDRMEALLECKKNKGLRLKKVIRANVARRSNL